MMGAPVQFVVDGAGAQGDGVGVKTRLGGLVCGGAQALGKGGIGQQAAQLGGEQVAGARGDEKPCLAIFDQIGDAANAGSDDGAAGGHAFSQGDGRCLLMGGQGQHGAGGQFLLQLGDGEAA